MAHHTTLSIFAALTLVACDCQQTATSIHQNGDVVHLRLTGEKVIILQHVYPAFTYDEGVYDVRHSDGRISEVKPFEIEK